MSSFINFFQLLELKKMENFKKIIRKKKKIKASDDNYIVDLPQLNINIQNIIIYYKSLPKSLLKSKQKSDLISPLWLQKIGRIDLSGFEIKYEELFDENDLNSFKFEKKKARKKILPKENADSVSRITLGYLNEEKILNSINNPDKNDKFSNFKEKKFYMVEGFNFNNVINEVSIKSFNTLNLTSKPIFFIFITISYILLTF